MRRLVIICLGGLVALGAPAAARGDAVIDWSLHAQSTILGSGPTAHASTLSFAMVHGAVYDAVNAIDGRYQPYLHVPRAKRSASKDAAAATAAFRVLAALTRRSWPRCGPTTTRRSRRSPQGVRRRAGSPPARPRPRRCWRHGRTTGDCRPGRRTRSRSGPPRAPGGCRRR